MHIVCFMKLLFKPVMANDINLTSNGITLKRAVERDFSAFNRLNVLRMFPFDKERMIFEPIRQYIREHDEKLVIHIPVHLRNQYKDNNLFPDDINALEQKALILSSSLMESILCSSLKESILMYDGRDRIINSINKNSGVIPKRETLSISYNLGYNRIKSIVLDLPAKRRKFTLKKARETSFIRSNRYVIWHELGHIAHEWYRDVLYGSYQYRIGHGALRTESYSSMLGISAIRDYSGITSYLIRYMTTSLRNKSFGCQKYYDGMIKSWLYHSGRIKILGMHGLSTKNIMQYYAKGDSEFYRPNAKQNYICRSNSSIMYKRRLIAGETSNEDLCQSSKKWVSKSSKLYYAGNIKDIKRTAKIIFSCTSFSYRKSFVVARELAKDDCIKGLRKRYKKRSN